MDKLIMMRDGTVVGEYVLSSECTTIGRLPGNDIQPNDPAVSRMHALVIRTDDRVFVEDLNSTNGTVVNGDRIKKRMLAHGDVIQIGRYQLKYIKDEEPRPKGGERSQRANPRQAAPEGRLRASIRILSGPEAGKILELNQRYTPLGSPGVQSVMIARRPEGYSITCASGNEARVNGKPVGTQGEGLKNGDIVEVTGTKMAFILK
jgi:hypothetical protein